MVREAATARLENNCTLTTDVDFTGLEVDVGSRSARG